MCRRHGLNIIEDRLEVYHSNVCILPFRHSIFRVFQQFAIVSFAMVALLKQ